MLFSLAVKLSYSYETMQGYASLAQAKTTNDDLIVGLLRNRGDKFSVEAARLGDGNRKEYGYPLRPI